MSPLRVGYSSMSQVDQSLIDLFQKYCLAFLVFFCSFRPFLKAPFRRFFQGEEARTRTRRFVEKTGRPLADQCKEGGDQLRRLQPLGLQLNLVKLRDFSVIRSRVRTNGTGNEIENESNEKSSRGELD